MIRALLWKEYREHRAIWLTLAVVGGAGLYGLSRLMAPEGILGAYGARESLQTVAVLFAWTYGLVCGSMLLANENEAGTMTFLDMLPARRIQLWLVKCLFGLLLLLTQVAVLAGFVIGLDITDTSLQLLVTLSGMLSSCLIAYSWSLLFSAFGDNVLNVIGYSFVGQIAGGFLTLIALVPVAIVLTWFRGGRPDESGTSKLMIFSLGTLGMTVIPLLGSVRIFTRLDRARQHRRRAGFGSGLAQRRFTWEWASWGRLLWLSYVQMRRLLVGLMIFSLALGLLLPLLGPAAWPILTLLLGVVCGVTVWSDEQQSAAFRFLGDQRFPLGRVWIVRVGMRFALAVFAAFLLLLPSLMLTLIHQVQADSHAESLSSAPPHRIPFFADLLHSSLVGPIVPIGTHLSMWLLYGFTAGHLCGLLFRKSLVAAVVALGSACMLVCLWIPSLVGIGLHFWQVAGVPLALLVAGWLLMPAWTADRLLARGTLVRLGAVLLVAGLWTAGGLWYRVAEIPDVADALDLPAFVAAIPSLDKGKNDAGLEIHSAWHEVEQLTHELTRNQARPLKPLFPDKVPFNAFYSFQGEIWLVLSEGWPNRRSDLGDKLDRLFRKEWYGHIRNVANCPLGVVEDAKLLTFNRVSTGMEQWSHLGFLNKVLAVRGLQMQTQGDDAVFVDHLRIGLALARNVQNHAPWENVRCGRQAELICINALDRWLEKLRGHPELLERVRDILLEHEAQLPHEDDVLKTAYLIALNTLNGMPEKLVEMEISGTGNHRWINAELQKAEVDLVSLLWRIPWEHERHQRILRVIYDVANAPDQPQRHQAAKWGGYMMCNLDLPARKERPRDKGHTASLHAAQLKAALRLFQAKHGKLPESLDELVRQKYLPQVPPDPFDGKPFRYRVTRERGEGGWFESAVVWSVGEDGHDDGGKLQVIRKANAVLGTDLIYHVPPPR